MSKLLDLLAGALWWLATKVEGAFAHHDPKRRYP